MEELSETAAFWRDNKQTACAAGRERGARVCKWGNSRKLETGRPAVGGTLIHVIGARSVTKTAEVRHPTMK